ncbi:MAG: DinB family protein, partial [Caldilineaceae bacterium]|nr:DinB family protein [Caldilineaceae bacterium]
MSQVAVGIHRQIRSSIHTAVEGLSAEQLHAMPDGFDNNIAWNLGHIMVVQQRILYGSSGLPLSVSEETMPMYLPDTSPADWQT